MNTTITRRDATMCRIPAAADLETWSSRAWSDGVQIDQLDDLESLVVRTMNSTYEITIISGRAGEVLVRGGQFFPEKTPAQLSGASFGGSFLKLRGVYLGLKMEFVHDGRRIVTSPVRSIGVTV
ncbi:MAG: hypothetical protein DMG13_00215 [Acidobacteria bacterium]|nr:MAG: hypothetical protein DMG13_00215 [Acidobacteriota bacterium]